MVLAVPVRLKLLAAKTLGHAFVGALVSLVVTVVIMVVGLVILDSRGKTTLGLFLDLSDVVWRNAVDRGLSRGARRVRRRAPAQPGRGHRRGLFWGFASSLFSLAPDVAQFGPTQGAPSGIQDIQPFGDDSPILAPGVAVLVMLGWIGVFFAAAAARLRLRDLV